MKKLTKITVLILIVAFTTNSYAQKFGVKTGLNISKMMVKDDNDTYTDDMKSKLGFQLGPVVEFPMGKIMSLETGLLFSTKGFKEEDSGDTWEYTGKTNLVYMDIPVSFRIGFDAGAMKIFGALGPYFGIGLTGKEKWEYTDSDFPEDNEDDSEKIDWGSGDTDDIKRMDIGFNIGAGAAVKNFEFGLNYGLGLANLYPQETNNNLKVKNRVFSITAAYKFGR